MPTIINHLVFVLHVLLAMGIVFVWLGNFFKKRTLLEKYGLYGDTPIFISIVVAAFDTLLIFTDFMYAYYDSQRLGYTLGSIVTGILLAGIAVFAILVYLCVLQTKIKET